MTLVCPVCERAHPADERFCVSCGMPLVHPRGTEDPGRSELAIRARKVRPGYAEGPLVRVAAARHQAEAEMIQGLLLEEGIPSVSRRSGGFDVPDFLASGPRDILVASSGEEAAREILADRREGRRLERPVRPLWVRALALTLALVPIVLVVTVVVAGLTFD
jgi:predicted nucleic acid-binding Zn ribbon protein